MPPSARITDGHTCPVHGGGPVCVGDATIIVGNVPAARLGDGLICPCGPDLISQGENTVIFGNMPAARLGDATAHGGALAQGCPTVLIGSTAQTEALKTDKPFCEKCPYENLPPELEGFPPVIIDAHMHIQSGNCAPLPPLRAKAMGIRIDRGTVNFMAGVPILSSLMVGDMGEVAPEPTHVVGERLISENNGVDFLAGGAGGYFVGISIVLTMDMDFCHLDGYDGLHIYQEDQEGRRWYANRKNGTQRFEDCSRVYLDSNEDLPMDAEEKDPQAQEEPLETSRQFDRYLKDQRSNCYETWRQQRRRTEMVAAQNPLRLLPLYHYEPRRYISLEAPDTPFKHLVENGGIYVGLKMYTSQGYMPKESTERGKKTGDVTRAFFSRLAGEGLPLQTHCTPEGWYTHHRKLYVDLATDAVRDQYKHPISGDLDDDERMQYFQEHFVHPEAWRFVMQDNPSLRLCLAHWASDDKLWRDPVADFKKPAMTRAELREFQKWAIGRAGNRYHRNLHELWPESPYGKSHAMPSVDANGNVYAKSWIRSIVEMCGEYTNFYTDLSYLPIFKEFEAWGGEKTPYWHTLVEILRDHPHMVDKLMFGTDWYMILMDKLGYRKWYEDTIKALEEVSKALEGQFSAHYLFHQFALINPIKFYRLGKIVDKLKDNLTAAIGRLDGGDKAKMLSDLERRHQVLAAACDQARMTKMQTAVKQGPLRFTGPEGWL
ncbi:PAAR domain-containing protein [Nannocystis sp. SCPEA4]|uniref:PAAR domain-containing protein n=1 Tax=Nannocystis sp. SCPEA4 TaxID=2996787 RepID=UPI002271399F|nr:PAAR domain-containing protein [Nannocystis sp. SCPEA4]MCY1059716.1 PAAR domain-containing protein [Nannocystis sp. SCPEA4]